MDQPSKIAIVTGAGSGVGRAAARALARDGWTVVLSGRRQAQLSETAELCGSAKTRVMPADVVDEESVKALFDQTISTFGRLNLLFNNAGISAPAKLLEELTVQEWQTVINTNLTGSFICTQQAFRVMKRQTPGGGRIINNGSVSAHVPRPLSSPYAASKHAITGLTKASSLEGRAFNIAVGQIDIGNAYTAMTAKMRAGVPQADGTLKVEATIDLEDVGRTVAYLASLPLEINVPFMTVMANQMPYIGRG